MYDGLIVFMGTRDMEKTHWFYSGLCGLKVYLDQGGCRLYSVEGGGKIGFCSHMTSGDNETLLTLVTDRVDEIYGVFANEGVEVDGEPRLNKKYGLYHFFAKDPDGHRVEIQKFLWDEYYGGKPKD